MSREGTEFSGCMQKVRRSAINGAKHNRHHYEEAFGAQRISLVSKMC